MTTDRESLRIAILREEDRLRRLATEEAKIRARLAELRDRLRRHSDPTASAPGESEELTPTIPVSPVNSRPATAAEKVALFGSLFRGRRDVFPRRWVNQRTGKSGYAPACNNDWVPDLCAKKTKATGRRGTAVCGDCRNQAFVPLGDTELLRHLQGRQVVGLYPLLPDDTCWLLAVDFDRQGWRQDVPAFADTCREVGVPVAIERSRSGDGAHAWFFFSTPISASLARRMGCFLLTKTMDRRHELSMGSYDRLFPSQDTMPRGGFGNLIALPLQLRARSKGNTEFLDDGLEPYADQWAYLAGLQPIGPGQVQSLVDQAHDQNQVLSVRDVWTDDQQGVLPWLKRPASEEASRQLPDSPPRQVAGVLAQRLFVDKTGLSSRLVSQIKRLAAFQNPEFHKKQSMRLSTALTPRVISCAEESESHVALPRGCLEEARALLAEGGACLDLTDERSDGEEVPFSFQGTLTYDQEQAVEALLQHDTGMFVAPPGTGKTVVGASIAAARGRSTLILVHRRHLLEQWREQLSRFLGLDVAEIGRIGAGKRRANGHLDVAMFQSLVKKGRVDDRVASYGHVLVDECHHVGAVSFERVLSEVRARYVTGLTATPERRDGLHPILRMQIGPVRFRIDPRSKAARRRFEQQLLVRETGFRPVDLDPDAAIQTVYAALAADEARNQLLFDDVLASLEEGRSPIVLTERRDHLEDLAHRFRGFTRNLVVLHGGMKAAQRRAALEQLANIPVDEERLLLATGRYLGEGFDDARLDTLFLALPVSWKGTLVQYAGRLLRTHPGKHVIQVYDYVDRDLPVLARMSEKRLRGFRGMGYAIAGGHE